MGVCLLTTSISEAGRTCIFEIAYFQKEIMAALKYNLYFNSNSIKLSYRIEVCTLLKKLISQVEIERL